MKMIIWAKRSLTRFSLFALMTLSLALSVCAYAKVETASLFVHLSDAMAEIKKGEAAQAEPHLTALQQEFEALPNVNSSTGQVVRSALNLAKTERNLPSLEQLSKALYAFEKAQNPVDYHQKRQQFAKRIMPVYHALNEAVRSQDLNAIQTAYKRFNTTWAVNEKIVRETSLGHYGQIETAMTLLRIAMLSEPAQFDEMATQTANLAAALANFNTGNVIQPQASAADNAPQTLQAGIRLLERSYQALSASQLAQAKADITLFIQQWPIFEGEVSTRDGDLYRRVESDLPLILAKGNSPDNLAAFQQLIQALNALGVDAGYNLFDAMLILLREGVEALLIIMALLTTLNLAKQPAAKRWVYAGAGLGLLASVAGAVALQQFFPAITAGKNREMLEGMVGIVAVAMMLVVGAWLHSKASMQGWKRFVEKQIHQALATGSLFSMLSLSFLSVFREGAETLLFYAGMLPLIETQDLLAGIGLALLLLAVVAWIMQRSAARLSIHHLFKIMTLLIYVLGFKILGVSIQALQLTQTIPTSLILDLPSLPLIGFYSSWQGVMAQLVYLLLIPLIAKYIKH